MAAADAGGWHRSPVPLEELEGHLREDLEQQVQLGTDPRLAFESAVQRMGQAAVLKSEFGKVAGIQAAPARVKQAVLTLAGIPNHCLDQNMNSTDSNPNLEPRWATYFKAAVFLAPAVGLWAISSVFLFPKLQQICADAGVAMPAVYQVTQLLREHSVLMCAGILLVLVLLERRSRSWPRYRRATIGVGVFLLNTSVLLLITLMVLLALLAAPALLHAAK